MDKKVKILVVEDDEELREILSTFLTMLGYEVCGAVDSGEKAIGEAIERSPGLALVDVNIQGHMDGIEAAPILIDILDIPVVFMSGGLPQERMKAAMETGPVAFQQKPFSRKDLHQTIEVGLATHAIRKRVQQKEAPAFASRSPDTACLLTNREGLVLYASRGVEACAPAAGARAPMVPWQDYLGITSHSGVRGPPPCNGRGSTCAVFSRAGDTLPGTMLHLKFSPLFSRNGKQIGFLIEVGERRGTEASACRDAGSRECTPVLSPADLP